MFLHPLHSVDFLRATVLPAVTGVASAAGRNHADVTLCCPVFVAVGDCPEDIEGQRAAIARQIAFYGSARSYRPVFDTHGWGDVCGELHRLMERGEVAAMPSLVTEEMLDAFSVTATWDGLAAELSHRYGGLVDRVAPYGAVLRSAQDRQRWSAVAASLAG